MSKARKKREPVKASVAFGCNLCPQDGQYYGFETSTVKEMVAHLRSAHEVETHKVAREVLKIHLTAGDYYRSVKAWTMPDGREVATKVAIVPREAGWT